MRPSGGLRQLIGKLFGGGNAPHRDPFSDVLSFSDEVGAPTLSPETLRALEAAIGLPVNDSRWFAQALTHRSYLQVAGDQNLLSNERLEYLGDSILNMLVGEFLFRYYADVQEGELTKLRSKLVNRKALVVGAQEIELENFILLNNSAERSLQQGSRAILADAFEAIIAAIYLDNNLTLDPVKEFLARTILQPDTFEEIVNLEENWKSILLELAQAQGFDAPQYFVIKQEGPDHERVFTVEVHVDGTARGLGMGRSKKKAEQQAAREAVDGLKGDGEVAPEE